MSTDNNTTGEQRVTNLAPILGRWKFEEGRIIFEGPERPEWPYGLCVSNIRLLDGHARVTVKRIDASVESRVLLGYRSLQRNEYVSVGLGGGIGNAYAIVHFDPAIPGWRPLAAAGSIQNLPVQQPIEICVRVKGQRILLEVDSVRVLEYSLPKPLPYGQLGSFTWSGRAEFTEFHAEKKPGDVFVVMQFSGFEELYTDVIEPLVREFGLRAYRADQVYGPGNIMDDIIQGIETSQIVIAEITPTNENVFYEVGYAHALKKPTILLVDREKKEKLPFDISGYRCLFYQNSIGGKRKVKDGLKKHLEAILDEY